MLPNDHEYPILFIATSNDRDKLPTELFRAGRFDETFIVMPPTTIERKEIFQKQIDTYGLQSPEEEILDNLVNLTRGYSGAEISKLVKEAKYINSLNPSFTDWEQAKSQVIPQYRSSSMQELLKKYQSLIIKGAGKSASSEEEGFFDSLII